MTRHHSGRWPNRHARVARSAAVTCDRQASTAATTLVLSAIQQGTHLGVALLDLGQREKAQTIQVWILASHMCARDAASFIEAQAHASAGRNPFQFGELRLRVIVSGRTPSIARVQRPADDRIVIIFDATRPPILDSAGPRDYLCREAGPVPGVRPSSNITQVVASAPFRCPVRTADYLAVC